LIFSNINTAAFAVIKPGSACKIKGQIKSYSDKKYTCVKSGKKLIWNNGVKTQPKIAVDPIKDGMQDILNKFDFLSISADLKPVFVAEEGRNGIYQPIVEADFQNAIKAMIALSGKSPYEEVYVLFGRTQNWLNTEITSKCTVWPFNSEITAAGSIGPCDQKFKNRGLIAINLPGVVTNQYMKADAKIDLTEYKVNSNILQKVKNLAPHEYYHFWQNSLWIGMASARPSWFVEGTAQVFSLITRAKVDKRQNSYLSVFNEWFSADDVKWSQNSCRTSIAKVDYSMETQCQYLQGILPVEVLLVNYGGLSTWKKLNELLVTKKFDEAFEEVTGITVAKFYAEVDTYAKTLGWESKN
jgi:hypothetical protein